MNSFLPVTPKITPFTFGDGPAQTGQAVNIQCFVSDGDLPIRIKWMLNGNDLESDDDVSIISTGKRSSALTIEPVGANHAGNYSCYAQNFVGSAEFSSDLKVIGYFQRFIFLFMYFLFYFPQFSTSPIYIYIPHIVSQEVDYFKVTIVILPFFQFEKIKYFLNSST